MSNPNPFMPNGQQPDNTPSQQPTPQQPAPQQPGTATRNPYTQSQQPGQQPYQSVPQQPYAPGYQQAYQQQGYQQPTGTPLPQGVPMYHTNYGYGMPSANPGPALPYYGCPFPEAVKRFLSKYAVFTGRASRSEFWWGFLFFELASLALTLLASILDISNAASSIVITVILGIPLVAAAVRRLHDSNKSGWWVLLPVVPHIVSMLISLIVLEPKLERFGGFLEYAMQSDGLQNSFGLMQNGLSDSMISSIIERQFEQLLAVLGITVVLSLITLISGIVLLVARTNPAGARFDAPPQAPAPVTPQTRPQAPMFGTPQQPANGFAQPPYTQPTHVPTAQQTPQPMDETTRPHTPTADDFATEQHTGSDNAQPSGDDTGTIHNEGHCVTPNKPQSDPHEEGPRPQSPAQAE